MGKQPQMDSEENPRMHKIGKKIKQKKHTNSSVMTHSKTVIQSTAGQEQASLSIAAKKSRWTIEGIKNKNKNQEKMKSKQPF